jgi:hypothetical protein
MVHYVSRAQVLTQHNILPVADESAVEPSWVDSGRLMIAFGVLLFSGFSAALRSIAYIRGLRWPEARMTGILASARSPKNSASAVLHIVLLKCSRCPDSPHQMRSNSSESLPQHLVD